jgi:hypothetical protein
VRPETVILEDGSEVNTVHYAYLSGGRYVVACTPNLETFHAGNDRLTPWIRTGSTQAVTCPRCLESDAFRIAQDLRKGAARGQKDQTAGTPR